MNFKVYFHHARLQPVLHLGYGQVVNHGPNFIDEKSQQGARCNVANFFFHVFLEVALYRGNGLLAYFSGQFNGHDVEVLKLEPQWTSRSDARLIDQLLENSWAAFTLSWFKNSFLFLY
jgi:hypothetical protein